MSNAQRFLNAHISIEKSMKEMVQATKYYKFYQLLSIASKTNIILKNNYNKLLDYNDLRNVLTHQRDDNSNFLASPTDEVVKDIENIAELLKSKKLALDFASKPVISVGLNDDIKDVFNTMVKLKTGKLPVYDDSRFIDLITMEMIASWAVNTDEKSRQVSSIINRPIHKKEVAFISRDTDVSKIIGIFEESLKKGFYTSVLIITESGQKDESPLGIITVFDIPKILAYLG